MAPATDTSIVIVAHGSPSAPEQQERAVRAVAARVATLCTAATVRGATLAADGALDAALQGLRGPLIYPLFMSDGWFVSTHLRDRLRKTSCPDARVLPPFGLSPAVVDLCLVAALSAAGQQGLNTAKTAILLAAHGSPSDPRAGLAANYVADAMQARRIFRDVRTGFVDQNPSIETTARRDTAAICIPFFATAAGHVQTDLPQALQAASFRGSCLAPVGTLPGAAAIIANTIDNALQSAAA